MSRATMAGVRTFGKVVFAWLVLLLVLEIAFWGKAHPFSSAGLIPSVVAVLAALVLGAVVSLRDLAKQKANPKA